MIEYKGYTISEGQGVDGVKIYRALANQHHAIASDSSLTKIVAIIDKQEEGESKSDRIEQMVKLNHLVRQVGGINPYNADPLEILNIFRELRWAVGAVEDSIMAEKFPKEEAK